MGMNTQQAQAWQIEGNTANAYVDAETAYEQALAAVVTAQNNADSKRATRDAAWTAFSNAKDVFVGLIPTPVP